MECIKKNYIRVKVEVDVENPLLAGFWCTNSRKAIRLLLRMWKVRTHNSSVSREGDNVRDQIWTADVRTLANRHKMKTNTCKPTRWKDKGKHYLNTDGKSKVMV